MRVAYFDLGYSREQYGLQPTRYGGGAVAARYLKEEKDMEFRVFAPQEAFDNVGPTERRGMCCVLMPELAKMIQRGRPVDDVLASSGPYDLILHPHTCETINKGRLNLPVVQFCGFDGSAGHPGNDYILLYDHTFRAQFGERAKYVRIGKPVPAQCPTSPREGFVFYCGRHDDHMNSIETARQAEAAAIPVVFAGPIHGDYRLLDYCDGELIRYVGEIDEETKLNYCRRAALFALPATWDLPFSQSVIEAQGQGTPIWAPCRGPFLTRYLKHGVNGFDQNQIRLIDAFNGAHDILRPDCHAAAREYDVSVMCRTFRQAFTEIVAEWRAEHLSQQAIP